ncbi:MAG TPA: TonB-dependent receptor, partial [Pyrinomonadaceae bacterium]|nr:TonB-dependent receptor [Pyrinomonadaceae bacterium]
MAQARSAASGRNNNFTVDGVSANFGIAPGGETPGATASGNAPALTASGGANGLATLDAIQEISIHTYVNEAEFARSAGAQVALITRAGTNAFHGSAFYFVGNDSFDASDWFANSRGLPKPPRKLNVFGGSLGGPIKKNKTFFFGAYEGMRFHQPMVGVTDVPSLSSRTAAPLSLRPFLDVFPIPNGSARPDGFAEFAASFDNPARHDVGSIRIDHLLNSRVNINGRYNFANSGADLRGADRLSLNTINQIRTRSQSATGRVTYTASPLMIVELFANYSRLRADGSYILDPFGGATLPGGTFEPGSFTFDLNSRSAGWMTGDSSASVQRQFNIGGSVTKVAGDHTFKFGVDYRRLSPTIGVRTSQQSVLFDGMGQALTGVAGRVNSLSHVGPQRPVFESFSLFAQDQWRATKDLTVHYGMRWDVAPAPSIEGSSLWKTTFDNFAPRVGFAYSLLRDDPPSLVLRGGVGMVYDVGHGRSGDLFANSVPFISGSSAFNTPFPVSSLTKSNDLPFVAFDPQLKLPYTINWHVSLEKALGSDQILSASYIGSKGARLLHTETLFDQNPAFPFLRLTTNRGSSDYRALGVTFTRRMTNGLAANLSYGLSQSLDNVTVDSERRVVMASSNPDLDRASSDFDVRHKLTGTLFYALPALSSQGISNKLTRNWTLNSIFNARSSRPLNVFYMFPTSFGIAFLRPDSVDEAPLFVLDPAAPGGRRINAEAFGAPAGLVQGTSPRNSLRGFPLYQLDLGLQRKFNLSEHLSL